MANNFNNVKVEIPIENEYILTIDNHTLIARKLSNLSYFIEFNILDNGSYALNSINVCSNIRKAMEEFCKKYNCPKRMLHDSISISEKELFEKSINNREYEELKCQLINTMKQNTKLNKCLSDRTSYLQTVISKYNILLHSIKAIIDNIANINDYEFIQFINDNKSEINYDEDIIDLKENKITNEELDKILNFKDNDTNETNDNESIKSDNITNSLDNFSEDKKSEVKEKDDITISVYDEVFNVINSFMREHSSEKTNSKCVINKFYDEFCKSNPSMNISYFLFVEVLRDIFRTSSITIENDSIIYGIIFNPLSKKPVDIDTKSNDINKRSISSQTKKSDAAIIVKKVDRKRTNKLYSTRHPRITKEDGTKILELWENNTGREIQIKFPQYSIQQITRYCIKNSDFYKHKVSKEFIDTLKSYNGTKTIAEMQKIHNVKNLKRLCINHNIPFKVK